MQDDDPEADDWPIDDEDDEAGEDEDGYVPPTHVFFENESLIRALNDPGRASNDTDAAHRLFRGLLEATLIALVPEDQEFSVGEDGTLEGDAQIGFLTVRHEDVDGEIIPMFTDEGSLSDFTDGAGGHYVALAVRDLFPLLSSAGSPPNVVVNPGGQEALLLTPSMVLDIVQAIQGYRPIAVRAGTDVAVSLPESPLPEDARVAIVATLESHVDVVSCHELEWQVAGVHDEPCPVLVVAFDEELDEQARRATFTAIQDAIEPALAEIGQPVDLIDLDHQRDLFAEVVARATPLYVRADA